MKRSALILILFVCYNIQSQSLFVFDADTTAFPVVKAKFYAFDSTGTQITNLSPSDFKITENANQRKVLSVSCPSPQPHLALSAVLVMDASGSMGGKSLLMAKAGAMAWVNALPLGQSECAVTAFDEKNYYVRDFTTDRNKLSNDIIFINANGGTDYNKAFIDPVAGGILVAKTGKHKKVVILLSDGQPNFEPKTQEIISQAKQDDIIVYAVTLLNKCPQCLKDITKQTGGEWFESITTEDQAREVYLKILLMEQNNNPCTIEWEAGITCQSRLVDVNVNLLSNGAADDLSYQSPNDRVAKLEFDPNWVKFLKAVKDTCITVKVTARNADFNVTNITASNPAYRIEPPLNFSLKAGESRVITICCTPADSGYTYCRFDFENDLCIGKLNCSGGFPGNKPSKKTIKLIQPNGGEVFLAGSDTVITWEGILPDEPVKIEYSTDNGNNWIEIAYRAFGLSYKWHVPNTPSNNCLARVTAKSNYAVQYYPEITICDQVWMGTNLNEDCYRNGDTIRHVTSEMEWDDAYNKKEGAWCYYDNDPKNGAIYGKLYNRWAVTDPRGLAPEGWHISTKVEWDSLAACLGGEDVAGGKMKSTGTIEGGDGLWYNPNYRATNKSGFSALPGGYCSRFSFYSLGYLSYWWKDLNSGLSYSALSYSGAYLAITNLLIEIPFGLSVRCVRD